MNLLTALLLPAILAGEADPFSRTPTIDEKFLANPKAPALNRAVLRFCKEQLGKRIGDGECATLAVEALRANKAALHFDKEVVWGTRVAQFKPGSLATEKILPGDILQFTHVRLERKSPAFSYFQSAPQHTAIVSKVGDGVLHVLHQNWGNKEDPRPVIGTAFTLKDLREGTITVFRPTGK